MTLEAMALAPTSALPEQTLLAGYAAVAPPAVRIEPCACGGQLAATAADWCEIAEVVRVHSSSTQHRRWREAWA